MAAATKVRLRELRGDQFMYRIEVKCQGHLLEPVLDNPRQFSLVCFTHPLVDGPSAACNFNTWQ
jgi:hypothetical protein